MNIVREILVSDPVPSLLHPGWAERWPWLLQGTTPGGGPPHDLGLFGPQGAGDAWSNWEGLLAGCGMPRAVHARQLHGAVVRVADDDASGIRLAPGCDGHVTARPGTLLAVSVADCVPVFMVAPERRIVAAVHAGWRGTAAGILEAAVGVFAHRFGVGPGELHLHFGPSICGECYEVGPEVHEALGEPVPDAPTPVDVAANLARRALEAGVPASRLSRSAHCTLCGDVPLFSHRGGDAGRQLGILAIRPEGTR